MVKFEPENLINSIVKETNKLSEFKPQFELESLGGTFLGDSNRMSYIV